MIVDPAERRLKNETATDKTLVASGSGVLCEIMALAKPSTDSGAALPGSLSIKTGFAYTFLLVAMILKTGEYCPWTGLTIQNEKLYT